jgi:hypothetical protein
MVFLLLTVHLFNGVPGGGSLRPYPVRLERPTSELASDATLTMIEQKPSCEKDGGHSDQPGDSILHCIRLLWGLFRMGCRAFGSYAHKTFNKRAQRPLVPARRRFLPPCPLGGRRLAAATSRLTPCSRASSTAPTRHRRDARRRDLEPEPAPQAGARPTPIVPPCASLSPLPSRVGCLRAAARSGGNLEDVRRAIRRWPSTQTCSGAFASADLPLPRRARRQSQRRLAPPRFAEQSPPEKNAAVFAQGAASFAPCGSSTTGL